MRVLLFEPHPGGHRFEYLARAIPALCNLDVEVVLATSSIGFSSVQFEIHLRELVGRFERVLCDDSPLNAPAMYSRAVASYRELRKTIANVQPDHVYLPSADGLTQIAAMNAAIRRDGFPPSFTEALHFAGAFGYQLKSFRRRIRRQVDAQLFGRAPWNSLWHVDPWQLASICRRFPSIKARTLLLPDPAIKPSIDDPIEARSRLSIPQQGIYFSLIGPVTRRKRLDLLLAAFDQYLANDTVDARLLIAGHLDADAQATLSQLPAGRLKEKVVVINRHFSADDMDLLVPASNVVVVPYEQHFGSSGIVLRAAAAGRPVVAADTHWLSETVTRFQLGVTCRIDAIDEFSLALKEAGNMSEEFQLGPAAKNYLEFQSIENFGATWVANLRERLGKSPDPSRIAWEDVLVDSTKKRFVDP